MRTTKLSNEVYEAGMLKIEDIYDKQYTTRQLEIFFDFVKHITDENFRQTVDNVIIHCNFLPTIRDFTEFEIGRLML